MRIRNKKYVALSALGLACSIIPPLVATFTQFPTWIEKSASCTISGIAFVMLLISIYPIFKAAKKLIDSPSIPLVWGIGAVLCFLLRSIIDQVLTICIVGVISGMAGWMIFKIRDLKKGDE